MAAAVVDDSSQVIDIGSRRQLFFDDAIIASSSGICFNTNPPFKGRESLVRAEARHLSGVSVAIPRLDGFVTANAGYTGGQLTTKTLRLAGNRHEINLGTGGGSLHSAIANDSWSGTSGYG